MTRPGKRVGRVESERVETKEGEKLAVDWDRIAIDLGIGELGFGRERERRVRVCGECHTDREEREHTAQ